MVPATRSSHCTTLSRLVKQTVDHINNRRSPTTAIYTPYLKSHEHVHACQMSRHTPPAVCQAATSLSQGWKHTITPDTACSGSLWGQLPELWGPCSWQCANHGAPSMGCGTAHLRTPAKLWVEFANTPHSSYHHIDNNVKQQHKRLSAFHWPHQRARDFQQVNTQPALPQYLWPLATPNCLLPCACILSTPLSATTLVATWLGPSPMLIPDSSLVTCASPACTLRHQQLANSSCQNVTV